MCSRELLFQPASERSITSTALKSLGLVFLLVGCSEPCGDAVQGLFEAQIVVGAESSANDIVATQDGGFVLTGWTAPTANSFFSAPTDVLLVRLDANLEVEWTRSYGNRKEDEGVRVIAAGDGGFIVLGVANGEVLQDNGPQAVQFASITKVDEAGGVMWSNIIYKGLYSSGSGLCASPDGGFVVTVAIGYSFSSSDEPGERELLLIKFNEAGNELWRRELSDEKFTSINAVVATAGGGYVLVGSLDGDGYVVKVGADGNEIWHLTTPSRSPIGNLAGINRARRVIQTGDGGIVLMCDERSSYDTVILKLDERGAFLWRTKMPGSGFTVGYDLVELEDGTVVVVGVDSPNHPTIDGERCSRFYAVRLSGEGRVVWNASLGGGFPSAAQGVALDAMGNTVLAGYKRQEDNFSTGYVLVTDAGIGMAASADQR